jgi:DNA-binding MurR/RpiR family transcriptional regulator
MTPAKNGGRRASLSKADLRHHRLDERLAARDDLPPSERAVAEFFLAHRNEIPFLSATEIAAAASVGSATVVRAAQRLGYQGLLELRRELRDELSSRAIATRPSSSTAPGRATESVLEQVISLQIGALAEVRRTIPQGDFDHAVDLLMRGERIAIFIGGTYAGLAQYFGRVLRRFGRRVLLVDTEEVSEALTEFGPGYVLVAFAFEVVSDRLATLLDLAEEAGVPAVLITDVFALALQGHYEVALSVGPSTILDYPTGVSTLAIIEALFIAMGVRDGTHIST